MRTKFNFFFVFLFPVVVFSQPTVLVDFGANASSNIFGLAGWNTLIKSPSVTYSSAGPGGLIPNPGGARRIVYSFTNISDPQSGVVKTEYAIGLSSGLTNVRGWTTANYSTTTAYPPSDLISALGMISGRTYYVSAKTTNRVGLVSTEFWTSIRIP